LLDDLRPLRTGGGAVTALSVLSVVTLVASMGMLGSPSFHVSDDPGRQGKVLRGASSV
jgi:hypothetical protein